MSFIPANITKPLTNQEVFNRVWDHAITRQAPYCSTGRGEFRLCRYRKKGNCCPIGALIPDDLAVPADVAGGNGCGGIHSLMCNHGKITNWFEHINVCLLGDIQSAHDGADGPKDYRANIETKLRAVAKTFDLRVP